MSRGRFGRGGLGFGGRGGNEGQGQGRPFNPRIEYGAGSSKGFQVNWSTLWGRWSTARGGRVSNPPLRLGVQESPSPQPSPVKGRGGKRPPSDSPRPGWVPASAGTTITLWRLLDPGRAASPSSQPSPARGEGARDRPAIPRDRDGFPPPRERRLRCGGCWIRGGRHPPHPNLLPPGERGQETAQRFPETGMGSRLRGNDDYVVTAVGSGSGGIPLIPTFSRQGRRGKRPG